MRYVEEVKDRPAQVDYTHEMRLSTNPAVRFLWLILGLLFTGLGIVGAFLPVMPTTVFLLIAAFFFARSSPKFYNWLLNNRTFGPLIRDWRAGLGLPLRAKILAVSLVGLSVGSSALIVPLTWVKVLLVLIGLGVCAYLLTRPTKRPS